MYLRAHLSGAPLGIQLGAWMLRDAKFSLTPFTEKDFKSVTITKMFNLLMIRLNIKDLHTVSKEEQIKEFFIENPFIKN